MFSWFPRSRGIGYYVWLVLLDMVGWGSEEKKDNILNMLEFVLRTWNVKMFTLKTIYLSKIIQIQILSNSWKNTGDVRLEAKRGQVWE